MMDGSTGGCTGPVVDPATFTSRIAYLSLNFSFIVANLILGFMVYESTKSLTVEVDFLSFGCEVLAVIINIAIEVVKRQSPRLRTIMKLDLVGGISSLALLFMVGVFGVWSAIATSARLAEGGSSTPASNPGEILQFSSFSLCLSVVNLSVFVYLKGQMLPEDGDVNDQLNILSNLAHSLVDFVTNFAVLGTSLWLQYGVPEENWFEMRKHKVWVDVFGSFMVCACILVSICWLMRDVFRCAACIQAMPSEEEEDVGQEWGSKAEVSSDYGTMQQKMGGSEKVEAP